MTPAEKRNAFIAQHMMDLPERYRALLPAFRGDPGTMRACEAQLRRLRGWINSFYGGIEPESDQFTDE